MDRWACWTRYDVSDRKAPIAEGSPLCSGGTVTRLKQNNLFALAKSYVERRIAASDPGLKSRISSC
jgi:hypothetical protein